MNPARALRDARRLTQKSQSALARQAGLPVDTVNRIERGQVVPRVSTLARLLEACGFALTVTPRLGSEVEREPIRTLLSLPHERRLPPRLVRALSILCARQVRFVLVGEAAARLHGAPLHVDSLEIVIGPDRHNPARLENALRYDWIQRIVKLVDGPYDELQKLADDIPWVAAKAQPRRVLNSWIGLPSGAVASLTDLIRMASGERAELLEAVQEERDAEQGGYRIYRRIYG